MSIYLGNQKVSPLIVKKENKIASLIDKSIVSLTEDDFVGATKIGEYTFQKCTNLDSVVIPSNITEIGSYAFYECSNITNLTIYANNTIIKDRAFCLASTKLTSLVIPNGVTEIGAYAFEATASKPSNVKSLIIPASVTKIGYNAFIYNRFEDGITILPNGLLEIGEGVFRYARFNNLDLPSSVSKIGINAFADNPNLTNVVVKDGVGQFGDYVFTNCSKLGQIIFKSNTPPIISKQTFTNIQSTNLKIIVPKGTGNAYKSATNWSAFADYIEEATE